MDAADTASAHHATVGWRTTLERGGYEHHCDERTFRRMERLPYVWRRILKATELRAPSRVFELGCGGGKQMAVLGVQGFTVRGIDCSPEVVRRAERFLSEVRGFRSIDVSVECADIFTYDVTDELNAYDLSFHSGVIEHFLSAGARRAVWEKLNAMTKPGGWIVSIVPCGKHFMRRQIRDEGLCGYAIPEIDYGASLHRQEFAAIALDSIGVFPHHYLGFLSAHHRKLLSKFLYHPLYLLSNLMFPILPLSVETKERFAHTLVVVGQKRSPASAEAP